MSVVSTRWRHWVHCGVAVLAIAMPSLSAYAAEPFAEPRGELPLATAVAAALAGNPDLATTAYELSIAAARGLQAGLRPNPQLSVELENFAGTGRAEGIDALETTLALSRVVEMSGKRERRVDAANYARELVAVERQARQLDVLAEVTRRFVAVVGAQQRAGLAQESRQLAEQTLQAISVRVAAARSPLAERSRAEIALTRARIEEQQSASALLGARRALVAMWGGQSAQFTSASADLFALPAVQGLESWLQQLTSTPDFLRFASEARLRDAELQLARAQARPDLNASFGLRHLQTSGDVALVAGVSIGLPWGNRNQGAIREAELRREQSQASARAARLAAEATVYRLYQEMDAVRQRTEALQKTAIPQAQRALDETRYGYERGRFSYLELASALQELLGLRAAAIDAAIDFHTLLSELERLTGRALAVDSETTSP